MRRVAAGADWIVVSSARSVEVVWPEGGMPPVPVAAVGPGTARAVEAAQGRVELTGRAGGIELVELLGAAVAGALVAFPHAAVTAVDLVSPLQAAGARVEEMAVYSTQPLAPPLDPVEAVLFGSASAVRGWCSARSLQGLAVAVTGASVAAAVRAAGHSHLPVPAHPGFGEALLGLAGAAPGQKGEP
jgi:uroporphyrinogen-III synthase